MRTGRLALFVLSTVIVALALSACDGSQDPEGSPLEDLDLIGVDFELNSMIIENNGESVVRTEDLWAYRDGESFQLNIFIIEPRATILFSMSDLGDISTGGGELALAESDSFDDPDSMLEYVTWGQSELALSETATEAGLWPPDQGTIDVPDETVALLRVDPTGTGPLAWETSDEAD